MGKPLLGKFLAFAFFLALGACGSNRDRLATNREPYASTAIPQVPSADQGFRFDATTGTCLNAEGKRGLNLGFRGECGDLHRVKLSRANFSGMSFKGAALNWADLEGANLAGADFEGADLTSANLSDATLTGARFTGATLRATDLRRAMLSGTDLAGATFGRAALPEDANLEGALCDLDTKLPSGWSCASGRVERGL